MTKKRTKPTRGRSAGPSHAPAPAATPASTNLATDFLARKAFQITRRLVRGAVRGNMKALRLCIERLVPMSRERALPVRIPAPEDALQITIALQAVFAGLGTGQITPGEAQKLAAILENQRKAIETCDLEDRLIALESAPPKAKDDSSHIPDDLSTLPRDLKPQDSNPDE